MKHWILGIAVSALLPAAMPAVEAAPVKKAASKKVVKKTMAKKPAQKLIAVRICPISSDVVEGNGAGSRVVKNYKAYFC